jgi:hypothetical protein
LFPCVDEAFTETSARLPHYTGMAGNVHNTTDTSRYYRLQAERCRSEAQGHPEMPDVRERYLALATQWDELADQAER